MKRRFLIRVLCIITVLLIIFSVSGCSSSNKTNSTDSKDAAKSGDNAAITTYPIVEKPLTLKYWVEMNVQATQYIRDYNENEAYQEVEKRTGIHMDFIHPAQGQVKEQFNLMMASGELPDIIGSADNYKGGEIKGVEDGVFLDLTTYMQKYAPDYYKLVTSDAETKREVTTDDGKFPAFYCIKPVGDAPANRIILRTDWLKELGYEIPRTIADYDKLFKDLKEKKNVVPYVLAATGYEDQFEAPFGVIDGFYLKDPKTVAFGQIQPQFKDYLALMNKWYSYGYISKDFPQMKIQQIQTQFNSGKLGMYIHAIAGAYNQTKALNIDITSAPFPRLKLGDKLHHLNQDIWPMQGQTTVISKDTKYKTEAVRWLNFGYTEVGARIYNYGVEGKTYVMENGKPKYTDYILNNPKYDSTEPVNYILKIHFGPKLMDSAMVCNPNLIKSKESTEMRLKWSDDKDVDSAFRIPPIKMSVEETDRRSQIMTDVNTYVNEMILKFIIGAEPLSKFDEFVAQTKKLGIDEAVKITQDAYTRYMSRK